MSGAHARRLRGRAALLCLLCASAASGCGTVEVGDNFVPPTLTLDQDFFYCRVQPQVISPQHCASGGPGEMGSCHSARSALRLSPMAETDMPPACNGNTVTGNVPQSYMDNLQAVRFTVEPDPLASPLYRRPTGLDSHPRVIFSTDSPEAMLIEQWISRGTM